MPYTGASFNGNACKKLLSNFDILRSLCPIQRLKYVECFENFKTSYLSLGISVTPKVHTVLFHIIDFCESVDVGLGRYSEQTVEAVHADFKLTWNKYKVGESNPRYPSQLLKAVNDYNSKHLHT